MRPEIKYLDSLMEEGLLSNCEESQARIKTISQFGSGKITIDETLTRLGEIDTLREIRRLEYLETLRGESVLGKILQKGQEIKGKIVRRTSGS